MDKITIIQSNFVSFFQVVKFFEGYDLRDQVKNQKQHFFHSDVIVTNVGEEKKKN